MDPLQRTASSLAGIEAPVPQASKGYKIRDSMEPKDLLNQLSDSERAVLERQVDLPSANTSFFGLFNYATKSDLGIVVVSSLCAICGGAAMPLMTIVIGTLSGDFQDFFTHKIDASSFRHILGHKVLYFVYLGAGEFVLMYVAIVGFIYAGEHIVERVRGKYFQAILRQNAAFFDRLGTGEITTRLTAEMSNLQDGISEKVAVTLTAIGTFHSAFIIAYIKNWKLALICTSTVVGILVVVNTGANLLVKFKQRTLEAYAAGGSMAEEVLSSMKNATAFGTQEKLASQYEKRLESAERWGIMAKSVLGVMIGLIVCITFLNYGLAFWMGSRFLVDGDVSLSQILTIVLAITIGAASLGQIGPNIEAFTTAVAASSKIYSTIDRVSTMDPNSATGIELGDLKGDIEFKGIKHVYPSRGEIVLEDFDLVIPARKTTAIIGASGSGKTTLISLIERFYSPVKGTINLDGHNISSLKLSWLRQQISLVQQEPVLFDDSIFNNIKFGLGGTELESESEKELQSRVFEAAKSANAHHFILALPAGYQTRVRNSTLSGGQKQRIAIARAIIKDPKILLLDEATSALDSESERVVQAALDNTARNRTTVVIAHRLSTIRKADNIIVMQKGQIIEQGSHSQLIEHQGLYLDLVLAQQIGHGNPQDEVWRGRSILMDDEEDSLSNFSGSHEAIAAQFYAETELLHDLKVDNHQKMKSSEYADKLSIADKSISRPEKGMAHRNSVFVLIRFVASFNRNDVLAMSVGIISSLLAGGSQPTQGVLFAESIAALATPFAMREQIRSKINFWSWMYFMVAFVQLILMVLQGIAFAFCSERLIRRARSKAFRAMLRQEISFFDWQENSSAALTNLLSTEIPHLAGFSGVTLGILLNCTTTLTASIIVSLAIGWKLTLVIFGTIPVILGCGYFRFWALARFQRTARTAYQRSAIYASEYISAIRTVASLSIEHNIHHCYCRQLAAQRKGSLRSNLKTSALYAASQSLIPLCVALGFWYGGTLISNREYSLFQFFICLLEVIFSVQSAGTFFGFAGDMGHAKAAAADVMELCNQKPTIDIWSHDGGRVNHVNGTIQLHRVYFQYPHRPSVPVLCELNLIVRPGQYVALVGESGCGKSTILSLIERFYDPGVGTVSLDGRDIRHLNLNQYRSKLALVSQEPVLYRGTIYENLVLGVNEEVTQEEIDKACEAANIYKFILSLPDGYSTDCGSKAALLSVGQKQRIAIARALLRKPRILLLDEATSALDSASEQVVQDALNKAAKGRTTIAVAHRLSTVQGADMIFYIERGRVVESGTHEELMARNGKYKKLAAMQNLEGRTG